jgi:hypothetical protein
MTNSDGANTAQTDVNPLLLLAVYAAGGVPGEKAGLTS